MKAELFWRRVVVGAESECWLWRRGLDRDGYGRFRVGGVEVRANRAAWELTTGCPVPADRLVMHSCDNPRCCNPKHLLLGTVDDNVADRVSKGRSAKGRKPNGELVKISHTPLVDPSKTPTAAERLMKLCSDKKRQRRQHFAEYELAEREGFEPSVR